MQCGFCIPGQIMTSYALLQRNPNPSQQDIRVALKDTLCRCAGYPDHRERHPGGLALAADRRAGGAAAIPGLHQGT